MSRSFEDARAEALECPRCTSVSKVGRKIPLVYGRTQVVFGTGPPTADLMFIGEAPGEEEDKKGEPFVGKAGGILNERLNEIGIPREEVYMTNIVMCRPTRVDDGCLHNRAPSAAEIKACAAWLDEQVSLVNPKLIVPLGVRATNRVLGRPVVMEEIHGQLVPGRESVWQDRTFTIIPTFHPTGARTGAQRQASLADLEIIRDVYWRLRRV
jgi:uracil-DNA glycosylase family 4